MAPRSVPERRTFEFTGVEMVKGPAQVSAYDSDLAVRFDDAGVTITGQEPGQRHVMPWADVSWASIGDATDGAMGTTVTPVEVGSAGTTVRFLLDEDRDQSVPIDALDRCLGHWVPAGRPDSEETLAPDHPPTIEAVELLLPPTPVAGPEQVPGPTPAPGVMPPVEGSDGARPARTRRLATLLVGIALIATAGGLAISLARQSRGGSTAVATTVPHSASDQRLAAAIMLTRRDLPVGWRVEPKPTTAANTAPLEHGQAAITRSFAGCMGVSNEQASVLLGGQAPDQTAQASSPIFTAPPSGGTTGSTLQLQTAASVVRTHQDEESDLGLFANHRYPTCAANATASELQLGVDEASGTRDQAGAATGTLFTVPTEAGQQLKALRVSCQVVSHGTMVPVEVDAVIVGTGRIEAGLEAYDIDGGIPPAVIASSVQAFEQRVATEGRGVQI